MAKYHMVSQNWNIFVKKFVKPKFLLVPVCFRNSLLKRQSGFSSENELLSLKSLSCVKLWGDMISVPFLKNVELPWVTWLYTEVAQQISQHCSELLSFQEVCELQGALVRRTQCLFLCAESIQPIPVLRSLESVTCGTYSPHQGFHCF